VITANEVAIPQLDSGNIIHLIPSSDVAGTAFTDANFAGKTPVKGWKCIAPKTGGISLDYLPSNCTAGS
jgi:hypothetical protein